jgi:NTE family protein
MTTPIYGIFEGGGAKGLAHIAGIKAAHHYDLEFIGVAGASAGAVIASLIAVGYRPDELFNSSSPQANIINNHGISTPLELLDKDKWKRFESSQKIKSRAILALLTLGLPAVWLCAKKVLKIGKEIHKEFGYFDTEGIRDCLNSLLLEKLKKNYADNKGSYPGPERIRFMDMDPSNEKGGCISLKIVATDIANKEMIVFDGSNEYKDVEVAEAVAASIAIPLLFKPANITSYKRQSRTLYADGGLTSNLPLWVFSGEKLNYERESLSKEKLLTLAFSLVDPKEDDTPPKKTTLFKYVSDVFRASIFGSQNIVNGFIDDVLHIPMEVDLGVAEFDFTQTKAVKEYNSAYVAAASTIGVKLKGKQENINEVLSEWHRTIVRLLSDHDASITGKGTRVSIIKPSGCCSFRVAFSHNMENDADDRMSFSANGNGAPTAFACREPHFVDYTNLFSNGSAPNMTKYEFALLCRSMKSAIFLPIFSDYASWEKEDASDRPSPVGVVCIDSNVDLKSVFDNDEMMKRLASESSALSSIC